MKKKIIRESVSPKFNTLKLSIKSYLEEPSEFTLHEVRISIRKLRYTLDVFDEFSNKEFFKDFYKQVSELQSTTGKSRDLDVIQEYMNNNNLEQIKIDKKFSDNKSVEKINEFVKSKSYKKFKKLVK
jgi:CHAD domain-containing protein